MSDSFQPHGLSSPGSSVHGFSKQEYYSGLPCPPPGDLANPGIEPASPVTPALQADFFTDEPLGKLYLCATE